MNKNLFLSILALIIISLGTPSFAETYNRSRGIQETHINGTVAKINTNRNRVVVKDNDTGKKWQVILPAANIASLKDGDAIHVVLIDHSPFGKIK